ncbi:hypothetical protein ANO11243_032580 [Dothideomycetidae sp. 11243]|nr:hypothetical protein ANO11243_032580 [fungal sp. No.11243]
MAQHQKSIAVLGSLNIDFVTRTARIPSAGETLTATSFTTGYGGKGANQAVAASRLSPSSITTSMVGRVGSDAFGTEYISALSSAGVDTSRITRVEGQRTGVANIIVEHGGENRILLAPNANHAETQLDQGGADVVVYQLEIPVGQVVASLAEARRRGAYTLLNPAPAVEPPKRVWGDVDCVVLNETEAEILCGEGEWEKVFFDRGVRDLVVLTLGKDGVRFVTKGSGEVVSVSARKVKEVVDTTAAGDTFVGALAAKIAENDGRTGDKAREYIDFANAAAALTVQKNGAMDSIPTLNEVLASINLNTKDPSHC